MENLKRKFGLPTDYETPEWARIATPTANVITDNGSDTTNLEDPDPEDDSGFISW